MRETKTGVRMIFIRKLHGLQTERMYSDWLVLIRICGLICARVREREPKKREGERVKVTRQRCPLYPPRLYMNVRLGLASQALCMFPLSYEMCALCLLLLLSLIRQVTDQVIFIMVQGPVYFGVSLCLFGSFGGTSFRTLSPIGLNLCIFRLWSRLLILYLRSYILA